MTIGIGGLRIHLTVGTYLTFESTHDTEFMYCPLNASEHFPTVSLRINAQFWTARIPMSGPKVIFKFVVTHCKTCLRILLHPYFCHDLAGDALSNHARDYSDMAIESAQTLNAYDPFFSLIWVYWLLICNSDHVRQVCLLSNIQ